MADRIREPSINSNDESGISLRRKLPNNPLGVICWFFSSVEIGLAYSSGVSTGCVQIAVLVFMALFATSIAATFFVFLWFRNWVFYPPSEFPNATVEDYVNTMRDNSTRIKGIALESVSRVFDDETLLRKLDLTEIQEEQREETVKRIVDDLRTNALRNVEKRVLRVDARPLTGENGPQWDEPYDADIPVHRLLDRVWFQLQPMSPHPYGAIWLLRDASSGRVFDDIGTAWAKQMGTPRDNRSAQDVGIVGGMTLEVVPRRG